MVEMVRLMEREKVQKIEQLVFDIFEQSKRRHRASNLKKYIETDLDIITDKSTELLKILLKERGE